MVWVAAAALLNRNRTLLGTPPYAPWDWHPTHAARWAFPAVCTPGGSAAGRRAASCGVAVVAAAAAAVPAQRHQRSGV